MDNFQKIRRRTAHKKQFFFFLLTISTEIVRCQNIARTVSLPGLGVLKGFYHNHSEVTSFLGIPYAKAPTANLRFQLPQAIFWNETRDATSPSPVCMQDVSKSPVPGLKPSEDCLYLNVYVPGDMSFRNTNRSVMVWIHGGGFNTGYADNYDMKSLASRGDVIVVTVNYRLNIFGFLSSGDSTLPGNAGLHDQVMALKWVKTNIYPFGGDPEKITIFGQSTGGVSVYILLASPTLTDGLFSRAIMQSGLIRPITDAKDVFKTVANLTSCPHMHYQGHDHAYATLMQIECMKNKTHQELLAIATNEQELKFGPVIDNVFLKSSITDQLAAKKSGVPCLIGLNNHEFVLRVNDSIPNLSILEKYLASLGQYSFSPIAVQLMLSKFLISDLKGTYMDAFNSRMLAFVQKLAMLLSKTQEVFMYYFIHHPSFSKGKYIGARHSDELPFVFGNVFNMSSATSDEKTLSKDIIAIWTSFARDGVPQLPNGVKWPPYEKTNRTYVELNVNMTADNVKQRLRESDRIFWNELIPKLMKMNSKPQEHSMSRHIMTTTGSEHHHHSGSSKFAWGMSEKAVQNLLLALLIVLIFVIVICVTLILILCKVRTIKLAARRHNNALKEVNDVPRGDTVGGNVNKAFANDANKSKPESITAL